MRKLPEEAGQSLLEFALVMPVLLLLLLGMVDFGRIIFADLTITETARDAARYASVNGPGVDLQPVIQNDSQVLGSGVTWSMNPSASQLTSGASVTVSVYDSVGIFDPLMASIVGSPYQVKAQVSMRVE